jgi:hypothetical protein
MNITKEQRKKIAQELRNSIQSIQIGRSRNFSGFGSGTPVVVVDGDAPPSLEGQPYLKTTFFAMVKGLLKPFTRLPRCTRPLEKIG